MSRDTQPRCRRAGHGQAGPRGMSTQHMLPQHSAGRQPNVPAYVHSGLQLALAGRMALALPLEHALAQAVPPRRQPLLHAAQHAHIACGTAARLTDWLLLALLAEGAREGIGPAQQRGQGGQPQKRKGTPASQLSAVAARAQGGASAAATGGASPVFSAEFRWCSNSALASSACARSPCGWVQATARSGLAMAAIPGTKGRLHNAQRSRERAHRLTPAGAWPSARNCMCELLGAPSPRFARPACLHLGDLRLEYLAACLQLGFGSQQGGHVGVLQGCMGCMG